MTINTSKAESILQWVRSQYFARQAAEPSCAPMIIEIVADICLQHENPSEELTRLATAIPRTPIGQAKQYLANRILKRVTGENHV